MTDKADKKTEKDLDKLLIEMNRQKVADTIEYVLHMAEILNCLGIEADVTQIWAESTEKNKLTFAVVIPMSSLEELKNLVTAAVRS